MTRKQRRARIAAQAFELLEKLHRRRMRSRIRRVRVGSDLAWAPHSPMSPADVEHSAVLVACFKVSALCDELARSRRLSHAALSRIEAALDLKDTRAMSLVFYPLQAAIKSSMLAVSTVH